MQIPGGSDGSRNASGNAVAVPVRNASGDEFWDAAESAVKTMLRAVQNAMFAERVEPLTIMRVMNRLIVGDTRGAGTHDLDEREVARPRPVRVCIYPRGGELWFPYRDFGVVKARPLI